MDTQHLHVMGMGLMSSVGLNVEQSAAAVKADKNAFNFSTYLNKRLLEIKLAEIPHDALPPLNEEIAKHHHLTGRVWRLLQILAGPLRETLEHYTQSAPLPLFLGLPESFSKYKLNMPNQFIRLAAMQAEVELDILNSRMINTGKAAGVEAISMAFNYMESTGNDFALVGGVDTFVDAKLLSALGDRVSCEGSMDSFIPSEAVSIILVASDRGAQAQNLPKISLPGYSVEEGHRFSDKPLLGHGLTEAMKLALSHSQVARFQHVFTSMNGENMHDKELGVASMRNQQRLVPDWKIETPIDCLGDIGAAIAPALVCLAIKHHKLPSVVYASSDTGACGALCIQS